MDRQTLLILLAISAVVAFAGLTIASLIIPFKRQAPRSTDRRALATITQIQVEAGTVSSWWMVTADWLDSVSGRILTFRSRRLKFPPHQQIGERVVVYFDQPRVDFANALSITLPMCHWWCALLLLCSIH